MIHLTLSTLQSITSTSTTHNLCLKVLTVPWCYFSCTCLWVKAILELGFKSTSPVYICFRCEKYHSSLYIWKLNLLTKKILLFRSLAYQSGSRTGVPSTARRRTPRRVRGDLPTMLTPRLARGNHSPQMNSLEKNRYLYPKKISVMGTSTWECCYKDIKPLWWNHIDNDSFNFVDFQSVQQ